jgi:hypothetical protein
VSELPTLVECFEPPPEQRVIATQSSDYVGVYCVGSHITVVTRQAADYVFPKVELWQPIFICELPSEIAAAGSGRYFAIWFTGTPSERGHYGACIREVRVTGIARAKEGRALRPDEYTW